MAVPQKLRCQTTGITDHGDRVYTVELRPERPAPRFRAGQFLHLALDEYDPSGFWPESRVFSIASSPSRRDSLVISYSVRGRFTARMEKELKEGRTAWIKLPYGEFTIESRSDVALFAGGTGITAFTAFLEGLTPEFSHRVYLAYGARSRELLVYRDRLREWAGKSNLECLYFVENLASAEAREESGSERRGMLSVDEVLPILRDPANTTFYLSGPPAMLKALNRDLRNRGVGPEAIRIDAWE